MKPVDLDERLELLRKLYRRRHACKHTEAGAQDAQEQNLAGLPRLSDAASFNRFDDDGAPDLTQRIALELLAKLSFG